MSLVSAKCRKVVYLLLTFALVLQSVVLAPSRAKAAPDVSITTATGGGAILADMAGTTWTNLGAITVIAGSASDIGTGLFDLALPPGFEYDTGTTPSISGSGGVAAAAVGFIGTNTFSINITAGSLAGGDSLIIGATTPIKVRPTAGTPLASGTIKQVASAGVDAAIAGAIIGTTSFGTLTEIVGVVSISQSDLASDKPAILANGTDVATLTLTLRDQFNNPISGHTTSLSSSGSNGNLSPVQKVTNASGAALFTFTSAITGTSTLTAADLTAGILVTDNEVINVEDVSAANSLVLVSSGSVPAGSNTTVTVTARTTSGNAVPGLTVNLASNRTADLITGNPQTTNSSGVANFTVSANQAGISAYTATVSTVTGSPATLALTSQPTVIYTVGAGTRLLTILPGETFNPGSLTGKSGTASEHTAGDTFPVLIKMVDANFNLVNSSDSVNFSTTNTNANLPANGSTALSFGEATVLATLRQAGTGFTITATDVTNGAITAGVSSTLTINYDVLDRYVVSGTPPATTVGNDFTLTVQAVDQFGNVRPGSASVALTDVVSVDTDGDLFVTSADLSSGTASISNQKYSKPAAIKIHASDGTINSNDAATTSITVNNLAAPTPSIPTDAAIFNIGTTNSVAFDWNDATGTGITYTLEYANNSGFTGSTVQTGLTSSDYTTAFADGSWYWRAKVLDSYGNDSGWSGARSFSVDTVAPTVTTIETEDLDANGKLDALKITFSENIKDSTLSASNFNVSSYSGEAISSGLVDDNIINVTFTEKTSFDTGATPTLTYTAGSLTDLSNNALSSFSTSSIDKALPRMVQTATNLTKTQDIDPVDGQIDTINVRFSENLSGSAVDSTKFSVLGYTVVSTPGDEDNGAVVLKLVQSGSSDTGATLNLSLAADGVKDTDNNWNLAQTIALADGAKPYVNITSPATGSYVNSAKVSYSLSEPMASGAVNISGTGGGTYTMLAGDLTAGLHTDLNTGLSLTDGQSYTVTISGSDAAGNISIQNPTSITVSYDVTVPTSAITVPSGSGLYNLSSWQVGNPIRGTAGNGGSGSPVTNVQVSIQRISDSKYFDGLTWSAAESWINASTSDSFANWSYTGSGLYFDLPQSDTYTIRSKATDGAGNVQSILATVSPLYDTIVPADPTLITTDPATGAWSADNTADVSWNVSTDTGGSGLAGYSLIWDTTATTTGGTSVTTTSTSVTAAPLVDGNSHYLHVRAIDLAGNASAGTLHVGPFWIDSTPSASTITLPLNGTYVNGGFSVSGTASDAGSGVNKVEVKISDDATPSNYWNGSSWQASEVWLLATGTTSWSYVSTATITNDDYVVTARATDNVNSIEVSGNPSVTLYGDTEAPAFGTNSTPTTATTGDSLTFTVAITDNRGNSAIDSVQVYTRYTGGSFLPAAMTYNGSAYTYTMTVQSGSIASLEYYFAAADKAGNGANLPIGAPVSFSTIAVTDNDAPIVSVNNSPKDFSTTAGSSITITANNTDNIGVTSATLYYRIGGTWFNTAMANTAGTTWSASIPAQTSVGTMAYYVEAKDAAANTGSDGAAGSPHLITLTAGTLDHFAIIYPSAGSTVSGGSVFIVSIMAEDQYNNIVTSFSDGVALTADNGITIRVGDDYLSNITPVFASGSWAGNIKIGTGVYSGSFTLTATGGTPAKTGALSLQTSTGGSGFGGILSSSPPARIQINSLPGLVPAQAEAREDASDLILSPAPQLEAIKGVENAALPASASNWPYLAALGLALLLGTWFGLRSLFKLTDAPKLDRLGQPKKASVSIHGRRARFRQIFRIIKKRFFRLMSAIRSSVSLKLSLRN